MPKRPQNTSSLRAKLVHRLYLTGLSFPFLASAPNIAVFRRTCRYNTARITLVTLVRRRLRSRMSHAFLAYVSRISHSIIGYFIRDFNTLQILAKFTQVARVRAILWKTPESAKPTTEYFASRSSTTVKFVIFLFVF